MFDSAYYKNLYDTNPNKRPMSERNPILSTGHITHISKPYGGRYSDMAILEQGSLVELMQKFDAVTVSKSFLIDDLCKKKKKFMVI